MFGFKQFINEAWEDYEKLEPARKAELIKYHNDKKEYHLEKEKEHAKVKANEPKGLEHGIAAKTHRSAATLHMHAATSLEKNLPGKNDFKVDAEKMSKASEGRSKLANG